MRLVEEYQRTGLILIGGTVPPALKRDAYEVLRQRSQKFNAWLREKMSELVAEHYEQAAWEEQHEHEQVAAE